MTTTNDIPPSVQDPNTIPAPEAAASESNATDAASTSSAHPHQRVRSFVIRAGRMTNAQTKAFTDLGDKYLIDVSALQPLDVAACFGREAPLVVEIGFGMGKSFIEMAQKDPLRNYLGIEVHPPGVGAAMLLAEEAQVSNVRIIKYDAFEVLTKCLGPESIDILQIFFPDPWPKARHHKRRLVNAEFLALVTPLLKHGGQIRMATDYGTALGFPSESLIVALLITQFVAFPSAILYNILGKKIGIKMAILIAIGAYALIAIIGFFMTNVSQFYILACAIGLFQGGIQALSRSYYTRLIPKENASEFYGFFNMLGKFAAIIGPMLVGIVTLITGEQRYGIISLVLLFLAGFILLRKVDENMAKKEIKAFSERA